MNKLIGIAIVSAVLLLAGACIGYRIGKGDAPKQENVAAAPEQRLPGGNVVAERAPDAHPPAPPQKLPAGVTEVRRLKTTVQPAAKDCPPVTVNTSLVRDGDGLRAVMDSPDGRVTQAVDIPIQPVLFPSPPHVWAAGASYEPFGKRYGAWVDRDIGRIRIGAEVKQGRDSNPEAWLKAGFTFG